jgi:signal transduction histidine kinase
MGKRRKERSRLAGELHDDFSQRLALLAFELENLSEELPDSLPSGKQKLRELWSSVSEVGADLHTVSHHLHSSTLKTLGLVAGIIALCKEFNMRQGLDVAFSSENIPRGVPPDIALCLFRVLQEGLQNMKKHSRAARGEVDLRKVGDTLVLDQGCGFDVQNGKGGLGILSMGERVRHLGGQFEIQSEIGKGTWIRAAVPLTNQEAEATENGAVRL